MHAMLHAVELGKFTKQLSAAASLMQKSTADMTICVGAVSPIASRSVLQKQQHYRKSKACDLHTGAENSAVAKIKKTLALMCSIDLNGMCCC